MKITFAVHHFPPRYTGGAELRTYRTAAALQERGHEVQVVCVEKIDHTPSQGPIEATTEIYQGVKVHRLAYNLDLASDAFRWSYNNPWIGAYLREQLQAWQPDIFHLVGGYLIGADALKAARELNIPRVISLTDFWWLCPRIQLLRSDGTLSTLPIDPARCARCLGEERRRYRIPGKIAPGLMQAFWNMRRGYIQRIRERSNILKQELNQANKIICPSQFLLDVHKEEGVDPQVMVYARQGRDFPNLKPGMLEKTPSDHLRVGYFGQISQIKGVHVLFEAAQHLPDADLTITAYGDPTPFMTYTARLRRMAANDSRLEIAGLFPYSVISEVLQNLDVMVIPSLWYENSPNVILEAFAHQTPVIASDLGGMTELVQHGKNGLLFEPGDPVDLSRQIQRLIDEPELLKQLQAGIEPVKGTQKELDEVEQIYQQVTASAS
jgi:glycosyltransferase involved in cell wall biosynthesis